MKWKDSLKSYAEGTYRAAEGLIDLVSEDRLSWKPETGSNWLTTAQLLDHIGSACGATCKGFVTGDWGVPPEAFETMSPEDMLPPAEKFDAVESVAAAREKLAADKELTFRLLDGLTDEELESRMMTAPWDPREQPLGQWIAESIEHLTAHKSQLFYYLKLQGVDVNTAHLWGM